MIIRNFIFLREFFIDGTFKVVPEIFYQLFVIHANYRDHIIPVAFVLLSGKTGQHYQTMINEIIALVPGWSPRQIMIDFEKALITMFGRAFPRAELSGCFFPSNPKYATIFTNKLFVKN